MRHVRYTSDVGSHVDFVWRCYEAADCDPLGALALACDLIKRLNPEVIEREAITLRAQRRKVRASVDAAPHA